MKIDCWYLLEGGEYKDNLKVLGIFVDIDEAQKIRSALLEAAPGFHYIITSVPVFNTVNDWIVYMADQNNRRSEKSKPKSVESRVTIGMMIEK